MCLRGHRNAAGSLPRKVSCPGLSVRVAVSAPSAEASLVRIFRLTKAKHREEAGHFGEDDGDSDSGFLTQVDFLREDVHDARSRRMQTSLSRSQIFFEVPHLEAGVAHYVELGHTELEDPSSGLRT